MIRVVAGYLDEMAAGPWVSDHLPAFLGSAAQAIVDMERNDWCDRGSLPELQKALVSTYPSVYAYVNADDRDLRTTAAGAAVE